MTVLKSTAATHPPRWRRSAAMLGLAGALAMLGGCYDDGYGYGGVSLGYGAGGYYDGYDGYGYGPGYYGGAGYGWYNDFYYPGSGIYVFDRAGGRHRWNDRQRDYWRAHRGDGQGLARGDRGNGFRRGGAVPGVTGGRPDRGGGAPAFAGRRGADGAVADAPARVGHGFDRGAGAPPPSSEAQQPSGFSAERPRGGGAGGGFGGGGGRRGRR